MKCQRLTQAKQTDRFQINLSYMVQWFCSSNLQKTLDLHLEYCFLHLLCKVEYYKTFLNPTQL